MGGILLPSALPSPASQWQLVDFLDRDWQSSPAAGGRAVLSVDQVPDEQLWIVDHMVCVCDSGAKTTMRLYLDNLAPRRIRDGSASGNFDVGDWPGGLVIPSRSTLLAEWTGATDGAVGVLALQARVFGRS